MGVGEELKSVVDFDASRRHATQLVQRLDDLLSGAGLRPSQIQELYVSVGPGSFTGVRVGVTVARTLGQVIPHLRCVAVPTIEAVALNVAGLPWEHLGVVMDAKEEYIYAGLYGRGPGRAGTIVQLREPQLLPAAEFLASAPRPLLVVGEALVFVKMEGPGISSAEAALNLPTAANTWRIGRRMAAAGQFTEYHHLLPLYPRQPEAVRLWEKRQGK